MSGLFGIISSRGSFLDIVICLISSAIVVFLTLPIHEYAHGFVATKLGDPTPRYQGRMTLNPLAHLDYFGSLMIFLFGFGYAKPVQVNTRYFNNPKRDMALVAFAGPLSNLIIAFISSFLMSLMFFLGYKSELFFYTFSNSPYLVGVLGHLLYYLFMIFQFITSINISLAVFNLVPIPPLDGSKLLAAFLPDRIYYQLMRYERYFIFIIFFLLLYGSGFSNVLGNLTYNIFGWFADITWLPFKIFI